jgi:hypothetical protein
MAEKTLFSYFIFPNLPNLKLDIIGQRATLKDFTCKKKELLVEWLQ